MKNLLLLAAVFAAVFVSSVCGQEEPRFEMSETGVTFDQPAFLTPLNDGSSLFRADPDKYGQLAMFLFSPSVKLHADTKATADEFERQLATKDVQMRLANKFVEGIGSDLFNSITIEKTELVSVNSLPTVRVTLNLKYRDEPYKCMALMFYSRKNDKGYYAGWLAPAKFFPDLTRDIEPAIKSITYK
jgi:hypothetical protein